MFITIIEFIKDHILLVVQISIIILLTILGIYTYSELYERERSVIYLQTKIEETDKKIISNFQKYNNSEQKKIDSLKEQKNNSEYISVRVNRSLLDEKKNYEKEYKDLEETIIHGSGNNSDSHFLMIALIICAAIEGSLVQSLREKNGEDKIVDFCVRSASGLGVGIVGSLFLSSSVSFTPNAIDFLPTLGLSMKVLIGFLIGMFSKELYEFLSDSIPAFFKYIRNKIPG